MKKGVFQRVKLPGHVVFAVELVLGEHPQEDVLGQDVLQQHLPDIGLGYRGADGLAAMLEEAGGALLVGRIGSLGFGHRLPQVIQHRRQIGLELLLCLPELSDLRQLVVQEPLQEPVQPVGVGHIDPHRLCAVLEEDGIDGILEDDVVAGIALVELGLYFRVEVVVGVLGLPVATGHAKRVAHRAVGAVASGRRQLGHQHQLFPVGGAVGGQAVLKSRPDVQLVIRTADLLEFGQVGVVTVYVRVSGVRVSGHFFLSAASGVRRGHSPTLYRQYIVPRGRGFVSRDGCLHQESAGNHHF